MRIVNYPFVEAGAENVEADAEVVEVDVEDRADGHGEAVNPTNEADAENRADAVSPSRLSQASPSRFMNFAGVVVSFIRDGRSPEKKKARREDATSPLRLCPNDELEAAALSVN